MLGESRFMKVYDNISMHVSITSLFVFRSVLYRTCIVMLGIDLTVYCVS